MGIGLRSETWLRGLMAVFCLIGLGFMVGAALWARHALAPAAWTEVDAKVEDYREELDLRRGRNRYDLHVDFLHEAQDRPQRATWRTEVERKFRGDTRERYRVGTAMPVRLDPADAARVVPSQEIGVGGPVILGLAGLGFVGFGLAAGLERRAARREPG